MYFKIPADKSTMLNLHTPAICVNDYLTEDTLCFYHNLMIKSAALSEKLNCIYGLTIKLDGNIAGLNQQDY